MIGKQMQEALNEQVNAELYSSYLYLSMEAYFQSVNLVGFANWMRIQTQEELMHVMKIYDFLNQRDGRVTLTSIAGPPTEWESPLGAFQAVLEHEQKVTGLIDNLVNLAHNEKDHATASFLQWFVDEQVEEESSANDVVQKLKMAENAPGALFLVDSELGQRVFTPPAAAGKGGGQ